jgi:hypothetical protein
MMRVILAFVFVVSGWASQYAPGRMQEVIRVRQTRPTAMPLPAELPAVDGYIAVLDCAEIGNVWYLRYGESVESFLVVDCAGDAATRAWMTRNNILVEVDHATALRWGVVGRGAQIEVVQPVETARVMN